MIVSDTSPISYLLRLGRLEILPVRFGTISIPSEVARELSSPFSPLAVREFGMNPPAWCHVEGVELPASFLALELDRGELEAIFLALSLNEKDILMDERAGRHIARAYGLNPMGLLGLLAYEHDRGTLEFRQELMRLDQLGFRTSETLRSLLLKDR